MAGVAPREAVTVAHNGNPGFQLELVEVPAQVLLAVSLSPAARLVYALLLAAARGRPVTLDRLYALYPLPRAELAQAVDELGAAGLARVNVRTGEVAPTPWDQVDWSALAQAGPEEGARREASLALDPGRAALPDHFLAEDERIAKYQVEDVLAHAYRRIGWSEFTALHFELIMRWVEPGGLGLPPEVVRLLIDECVDRGKIHPHYMNRIAERWAARGITSIEAARAQMTRYRGRLIAYRAVCRRLGWSRPLTEGERSLFDKWVDEWGFSQELILAACDETTKTDAPSFAYVDAVLRRWRELGVRTVAEARAVAERRREPGSTGGGREPQVAAGRRGQVAATARGQDYWGSYYRVLNRRKGHGEAGQHDGR